MRLSEEMNKVKVTQIDVVQRTSSDITKLIRLTAVRKFDMSPILCFQQSFI